MRAMGSKFTVIEKPAVPERSFCRESDCSTSKQPTRRAAARARPGRAHRRIVFMRAPLPAGPADGVQRTAWLGSSLAQFVRPLERGGAGRRLARMRAGGQPMAGQGSTGNVIAALASFFIPGLGQLLQGRVGTALVHFVLGAVLWFFLLGWVAHLWSTIDAARYRG